MKSRVAAAPEARSRGLVALATVLLLLAAAGLGAAGLRLSLHAQLRASAAQARAAQAFEAAQAGLEWGLGWVAAGAVDEACERLDGAPLPPLPAGSDALHAWCSLVGEAWRCECPALQSASSASSASSAGSGDAATAADASAAPQREQPAFRVTLRPTAQATVFELQARGCSAPASSCLVHGLGTPTVAASVQTVHVRVSGPGSPPAFGPGTGAPSAGSTRVAEQVPGSWRDFP